MNTTANYIKEIKNKIQKLEKSYGKGVHKGTSFTVSLFYGGNKEVDLNRCIIGSMYDDENAGQQLYDLIMRGLKAELKFWEQQAEKEIKELNEALFIKIY